MKVLHSLWFTDKLSVALFRFQLLLKDDGIARIDAREDLGFGTVGDAGFDGNLAAAVLLFRVWNFDRGVLAVVIENSLFRYGENIFVLVEDDLRVGGHIGFELAAGVIDGDTNLEGGDIILFNAEWGDLRDLTLEGFVLEGFDLDAGGLAEIDPADIRLVDLTLDVDVSGVADGHDEGSGGAEDEDRANGVTDLNVAGENDAVHGRDDGGVTELLFQLFERCLVLCNLRFGLAELGGIDGDLGDGLIAGIGSEEVFLLCVIEGLLGDDTLLGHLQIALIGVLVHGKVRGFGVDLVVFDGGSRSAGVGLGGSERGLLGGYLVEDLLLIELGKNLTGTDVGVDVSVEAGDNTGGFGFDLYLGDGLYLTGGDDGAGDISALGLCELRRFELGCVSAGGHGNAEDCCDDQDAKASPEPEFPFVFTLCGQSSLP